MISPRRPTSTVCVMLHAAPVRRAGASRWRAPLARNDIVVGRGNRAWMRVRHRRDPAPRLCAPCGGDPDGVPTSFPFASVRLTLEETSMDIVCLLFDGITALDIIGPYETLQRLPDANVKFVAHEKGPVRTDNGFLALVADYSLDEVTSADVLV